MDHGVTVCLPQHAQRVIAYLSSGRQALIDALAPLARLGAEYLAASEGAIYLWAKLPPGADSGPKTTFGVG